MTDVAVAVGTVKGVFVLTGTDRGSFDTAGPMLPGQEVYAIAIDTRGGRRRLLAGATDAHWGTVVRHSDDLGRTWSDPAVGNVNFPDGAGASVERVWQLQPAGPAQPDLVYAGVEPAALFVSEDAGEHFALVRGLWDHPHRPSWEPGGGGLCLHTVLVHPADASRLLVAISTGGVYLSDDGGATWRASNNGIKVMHMPEPFPEYGQCVHKVGRDATDPDTLFLQNHGGIYRSDDGGASWVDIGQDVVSDFGFPVVTHPRAGRTSYVIPLESDERRWTPEGRCRVFRTQDGGESWQPLTNGLPQDGAWLTVLRDGFTTDGLDPAGLYFGTRTGQVFGSADEGGSWQVLAEHLPPVLSVRAAAVG